MLKLAFLALAALCVGSLSAQAQDAPDASSSKVKAEKSLSGDDAKRGDAKCVAVHDFSVATELQQFNINGWSIAELLESELAKGGRWKLVTRAKIAKALKEQKFGADGSLEAAKAGKLGKLIGADFIVTGSIERKGSLLIITAKLIDVAKETGRIERSFSVTREIGSGIPDLSCIPGMLESAGRKLVMTPDEFLALGRRMLSEGDLLEARDAFSALASIAPSVEAKSLLAETEKALQTKRSEVEKAIGEASKLFLESKDSQNGELCARAIKLLETQVYAPRPFLSPEQRARAESLLVQMREFKKGLYNGPSEGSPWSIPDLGVELIPVKLGRFKMGDPNGEDGCENPQRTVTITRMFWIGRTEVTIGQFLRHLKDSSDGKIDAARDNEIDWDSESCPLTRDYRMKEGRGATWGDLSMPVVNISWCAADNFCKWLTKRERAAKRLPPGYMYRLPTEAEWEYACRAGGQGDAQAQAGSIDGIAWHTDNSGGVSHPAGKKAANPWGLHDVCGNAWEWCHDWYDGPLMAMDATDPKGPGRVEDDQKVMRGGSAQSKPSDVSPFSRAGAAYRQARANIGFRIVCAPEF